jgi:hypothetical protein
MASWDDLLLSAVAHSSHSSVRVRLLNSSQEFGTYGEGVCSSKIRITLREINEKSREKLGSCLKARNIMHHYELKSLGISKRKLRNDPRETRKLLESKKQHHYELKGRNLQTEIEDSRTASGHLD